MIINPIGMQIDKTDILGLFSAIGAALAYTAVRELREYYDTKIVVLSFMGIFATIAQLYVTKAYSVTKAGLVAAASYMNIIFSLFIGVMLGDSFPEMVTIFGIFLVIFGGVMAATSK